MTLRPENEEALVKRSDRWQRRAMEAEAKVAAAEALAHELVSNGSGNSLADRLERQIGMRLHRALRTKP
jgi:hypothetical protein